MFKGYVFFVMACMPLYAIANEVNSIHAKSTLKSVTVFMHGAELHATAEIDLKSASQDIIIEGLPTMVNAESVQVSGTGDFTILSVLYKTDYIKHRAPTAEVKVWQDSINLLELERRKLIDAKDVAQSLSNLLDANKNIAGSQTGLNAETYQKVLDIYVSKLMKVKSDMQVIDQALDKRNILIDNLRKQLAPYPDVPTGEVIISVNAHNNTHAHLNISYVVNNAGWTPQYDVRCMNVDQPLSIIYKAAIFQSSGMDWNNVKLSINTGNPTMSANSTPLNPWYLNFLNPNPGITQKSLSMNRLKPAMDMDGSNINGARDYHTKYAVETKPQLAGYAYNNTVVELSPVSTEYVIDETYTIPSDNTPHQVSMQNKTVPVFYEYSAAPKVDKEAFLNAFIVRWDTFNFLSGEANIFFMGNYVGKSFISGDNTGDTMSLFLGRDKAIAIKRTSINNITRTKFLSDKISKSFSYDINVRNTHNQNIVLKLYDQLPLSSNSQIEVTDTSYTGAKLEMSTGKLVWDMKLKGGESRKVNVSFTVKYPKGTNIGL